MNFPLQTCFYYHKITKQVIKQPIKQSKINKIKSNINNFAKKRPVFVATGMSLTKTCLADLIVQSYVEKKKEIDWKRNLCISGFGIFYSGAFQYFLFNKCYPFLFNRIKNNKLRTVAQLSFDSLVHSPLVFFPTYYLYKNTVNTGEISFKYVYEKYFCDSIKRDIPNAWGVWIPAHIITFGLMPTHLKVPWILTISFGYTMLLSYTTK